MVHAMVENVFGVSWFSLEGFHQDPVTHCVLSWRSFLVVVLVYFCCACLIHLAVESCATDSDNISSSMWSEMFVVWGGVGTD